MLSHFCLFGRDLEELYQEDQNAFLNEFLDVEVN